MLNILSSRADESNPQLPERKREGREGNLAWIERNLPEGDGVLLLLLGGKDPISFRIRTAQAELRDDLTPSNWSHVAFVEAPADDLADTPVREIWLAPRGGFEHPAKTNGVQEGTLGAYRSSRRWPNLALVRLPVASADYEEALDRFQRQRAALDAVELVVAWLAYVWGAGQARNPLMEGIGVPSAALAEAVTSAVGYDLTPGLESRASCPEAIWQAARWWHLYYDDRNHPAPTGAWVVGHWIE